MEHTDNELNNLYILARRAREQNNYEYAQKYYEQVIVKDPSSWEANFYTIYYQAMNCNIEELETAALNVKNCEKTVFSLIKENVTDPAERKKAVKEVAKKLDEISDFLFKKSYFTGVSKHVL